ncbi:MAG TPA: tetratricopeptide repeat protein [Phycisphaerae bacterium]
MAAAALLFGLVIAAYFPTFFSGYIWDDDLYLTQNPAITQPGGLGRIWLSADCPQYYPLVFTTFWVEHHFWGLAPAGYHLVNVALHATNALLLAGLLARLGVRGTWLAAAIFAVHPVHVESVAWITERKNVLSLCFYLLAFRSFLRFEDEGSSGSYFAALVLFAAALLSKTITCSLPVALFLVRWARGRPFTRRWLMLLVPFVIVGLGMASVTVWYEHHRVGAVGAEFDLSLAQRIILAGRALWFYAEKLIWPANLTFIYPRWSLDASSILAYIAPASALLVLLILLHARRRIGRWPFVAIAFFALTLVPALGFISVFPMRYSFVADHFQYIASIGFIALLAGVALRTTQYLPLAIRAGWLPKAIAGLGLCVLALFTWMQTFSYADEETLWRDTLARNPQAWIAHVNLGVLLHRQGDYPAALECQRRATQINPEAHEAWAALGAALEKLDRPDEAIAAYERAVSVAPRFARAHFALAEELARQSRWPQAIQHYRIALQLKPDDVRTIIRLVETLTVSGNPEAALAFGQRELERLRGRPAISRSDLDRLDSTLQRLRAGAE